jgi:hypothetical protein
MSDAAGKPAALHGDPRRSAPLGIQTASIVEGGLGATL